MNLSSVDWTNAPVSAWYGLSMVDDHTLCVYVHRDAYFYLQRFEWSALPSVRENQKTLDLSEFILPEEDEWGYDKVLRLRTEIREGNDWIGWEFELPKILAKNGGGDHGEKQALAIRATLNVLFLALSIFDRDTASSWKQLLVVDNLYVPIGVQPRNSASVDVVLTPSTAAWLSGQVISEDGATPLGLVSEAMQKATQWMWEGDGASGFTAEVRWPKLLYFNSLEGSSGVGPIDPCSCDGGPDGYELCCHNIGNSVSQLCVLVGLAKLHDLIRAGMK